MLCLTRKEGQRIIIDDKTVITILDISKGRVRIGFEGPTDVKVMREEINGTTPMPKPAPAVVSVELAEVLAAREMNRRAFRRLHAIA